MAKRLTVKYYVEADPAALARRAAQYFVEMAGEAVAAQGCVRIAISGGSTPKAAFEAAGRSESALAQPNALGEAGSFLGG